MPNSERSKKLDAIDFGRADQAAIERVRPAVVGALQDMLAAGTLRDGSGTVAADIAEGAKLRPFCRGIITTGSPATSTVKNDSGSAIVRCMPFTSPQG